MIYLPPRSAEIRFLVGSRDLSSLAPFQAKPSQDCFFKGRLYTLMYSFSRSQCRLYRQWAILQKRRRRGRIRREEEEGRRERENNKRERERESNKKNKKSGSERREEREEQRLSLDKISFAYDLPWLSQKGSTRPQNKQQRKRLGRKIWDFSLCNVPQHS